VNAHKLAAFSCIFDKSGQRIVTVSVILFERCFLFEQSQGGDDFLVKIWCAKSAWLIYTLRGHQDVIIELTINSENTILASGSNDGFIRLWKLETSEPLAVFPPNASTSLVINFCESYKVPLLIKMEHIILEKRSFFFTVHAKCKSRIKYSCLEWFRRSCECVRMEA
jgi:WD40 repeat protein